MFSKQVIIINNYTHTTSCPASRATEATDFKSREKEKAKRHTETKEKDQRKVRGEIQKGEAQEDGENRQERKRKGRG